MVKPISLARYPTHRRNCINKSGLINKIYVVFVKEMNFYTLIYKQMIINKINISRLLKFQLKVHNENQIHPNDPTTTTMEHFFINFN